MENRHKLKRIGTLLFHLSIVTSSALIALLVTIGGWQPGFAQVVDWCSQPNILWCSSFEETSSNGNVFTYTLNLPTGNSTYGGQYGWYASPGGFVDRNDEQYTVPPESVRINLPITITQVSTSVPARSGETTGKRFAHLNADTTYAISNINPSIYTQEISRSAGIFFSRKTQGDGITLNSTYTKGLYYSSWYYFPTNFTSTVPANQNLMVMEFMVQSNPQSPKWRRPWTIHLQGKTGNKMAFRVDEWSGTLHPSNPSRLDDVIVHNSSPRDVPINKWVHLEVFYKYAPWHSETEVSSGVYRGLSDPSKPNDAGEFIVFQDGVEIYRFNGVATGISAQDTLISNHWIVTAYAHKSNPANFNFYVDDSAISTVRLGGGPREVLTNGDFANGSTPWRIDNNLSGTYSVDVNAGLVISNSSDFKAGFVDITAPGPTLLKPTFYQTIPGGVLSGTAYTLRFSAKSDQNQISRATVQNNAYNCCGGDPALGWAEQWNSNDFLLSPTLQNFVYIFTPTVTASNVNLHIRAGLYTRKIWVDGVSLVKNDNLLLNGDFSVGATGAPWKVNNPANANFNIVSTTSLSSTNNLSAAEIQITNPGTNAAAISQPAVYQVLSGTVDPGVTYTLRFTARASTSRTMRVAIQRTSDWSSIWWQDCGNVSLTQLAQNFICTFTFSSANTPEANPVLNFLLGNQGTNTVWIDNVSLSRSN